MFKFTSAPVSIGGGGGGQEYELDDVTDAPPVTFGGSTENWVEEEIILDEGGGHGGTP